MSSPPTRHITMPKSLFSLALACLYLVGSASAQKLLPLATYTSNTKISAKAKSFYKKIPQYKKNADLYHSQTDIEQVTNSIHDSVYTKNSKNRAFYLYLMNRNMDLSDGSLMMSSILAQYKLIETYPAYFFQYMLDNPAEKKVYFEKWATQMLSFSEQYCESKLNTSGNNCLSEWNKKWKNKLAAASPATRKLADEFAGLLSGSPTFDNSTGIPTFPPTIIRISEKDNGKNIAVHPGNIIEATFRECRGCASVWKVTSIDSNKLHYLREDHKNPSCTDCAGGENDHIFSWEVIGEGAINITLRYFDKKMVIKLTSTPD